MPTINLEPLEEPSRHLFLTPETFKALDLEPGGKVIVRAGSVSGEAALSPSVKQNFVSTGTLKSLGIPAVKSLKLVQEGHNRLHLGPLLGIMISRERKFRQPPFTSQKQLLQSFLSYGALTGTLGFVFFPSGVDTGRKIIDGFYMSTGADGKAVWHKHTFPLPDIIYDRVMYRSQERQKLTKNVTAFLAGQKNLRYFNPKFLNKWETHLILSFNRELKSHLPETVRYSGVEDLVTFLSRHNSAYLKPINGSLSKGIVRVSSGPKGYSYLYRKGKRMIKGTWSNRSEMHEALREHISGVPYIMQKGLDLLKYKEKVFDVRVLVQKNGEGQWINSATVIRVSPEGSIFPNIAAGGTPMNISTLWPEIASEDWAASETCKTVTEVCLAAARTVESSLGTFAELGLDIGVGKDGHIWIIEINSKPSRKVFPRDQLYLKKTSIRLPVDFANFLAGFSTNTGSGPN